MTCNPERCRECGYTTPLHYFTCSRRPVEDACHPTAIAPAPAADPLAAALEVLEGVVQPSDVVQSRIAAIQLSVRLAPVALRELMAWRACADDPFEDLDTLDAFRAHANELGVALDEARAATDRALEGEPK